MNYKDTLNLPKTDFSMKANLPQREPLALKDWEQKDIYGLIRKASEGKKRFILHDGPPYANGNIHMGHALNKILKDIIIKYKTMTCCDAPYIPGWDCHGLPVEHQLFKELNITKADIGQVEFRKKAHRYAMRFVDIQREEFKRLGIFGDWNNPYITLNPEYEAGIIESFARLVELDYIYKALKPVNWCVKCETALAEAEVEYADKSSPSVYVKFKVKDARQAGEDLPQGASFLIWTTTPWTLVANVAIAVHPKLTYALIETEKGTLVMAEDLMDVTLGKLSVEKREVLKRIPGKKLEGVVCSHPFIERDSRVVLADYVSNIEGTGCVHIAPGHGQEDYMIGRANDLPTIMPVNQKGLFDDSAGKLKGLFVYKANKVILEDLKASNDLLYSEEITHSYPHCWRCKEPIIFRATEQYFMNVDKHDLRKNLLEVIKKVKWIPASGISRMSSMIEKRPDWCLSRQRLWGVPIPAFYCLECNKVLLDAKVIRNVAEVFRKEGSDAFFKKGAEELMPPGTKCSHCKNETFKKETDILDVWFESGVSHQSVLKRIKQFPSDLYLEGSDQHRGWFQSSLISSMAIEKKPPYGSVMTHGFVVDGEGKKMSKSLGNVIAPQDIMKRYGADMLRLWVASSDYNEDVRLSEEILKRLADAYRKIRNTFRYLLSNLNAFDLGGIKPYKDMIDIDKWAIQETKLLLDEVTSYYENYTFHMVYHSVYKFCTVTMSSIYLDILKDRLYTFAARSPERQSGQSAIYTILTTLVRMIAPILCFTTEEAWAMMPGAAGDSVHLAAWPDLNDIKKDTRILDKYKRIFEIRGDILVALEEKRQAKMIGSPLEASVAITPKTQELSNFLKGFKDELATIFIVSAIRIGPVDPSLDKEYSIEVKKSGYSKCERCWNYKPTVGSNGDFKELCDRCVEVVKMLNKEVV
ncbi:MAG: isoleucine--tRNA ligase [Candidatus Omnitrophota bacterium]